MVGNESEKQAKDKDSKITSVANQDQPSCTSAGPANPEWPGFQAYSPVPPHGFVASSPQGHPYMWGVQPMMPPYGTPPHPYVAMYPHGGIYAHPSIPPGSYPFSPFVMPSSNGPAEASGNFPGSMEGEGKSHEVKEKLPIKRSKGSLGSLNMIMGKDNELAKTSGTSANGVDSKSGDSATEDSTDGSDSNSQNDSQNKTRGKQDSMEGETSHNGSSVHGHQHRGPNAPHTMVGQAMQMVPYSAAVPGAVPGPATNLNIGMEYWGTPTSAHVPSLHGKVSSGAVPGGIVTPGSRDSLQPQLWMQDEREIKKERRKQSNRESARRSRLRKQAECEELALHADSLKDENATLREEVNRIRIEYEQLIAENVSLKEKLGDIPDSDRDGQDLNNDSQQIAETDEPTQNCH